MESSVHVILHVFQSLVIIVARRSLPGKSEVLVNSEFSGARVASGEDGKSHNDS